MRACGLRASDRRQRRCMFTAATSKASNFYSNAMDLLPHPRTNMAQAAVMLTPSAESVSWPKAMLPGKRFTKLLSEYNLKKLLHFV